MSGRRGISSALGLYLAVALGTGLGSAARAAVSLALAPAHMPGMPWDSLLANAAGSFLIGLYAGLVGPDGRFIASARTRHFVMTGVCGGFTSFSVFSLESFRLIELGALGLAAATIGGSVLSWMVCVWLGRMTAERLNRPKGR